MAFTRRTAMALVVAAALFMEILDATIITTALPLIARDFGVPASHLSSGIAAYLVAVTIFIPVSGYLADRFGPRNIFACAIIIFAVASVFCAVSDSLSTFTLARCLQGAGGALMVPVGRLVVIRDLPKEKLMNAIAILTWPALGAPLLGPVLGGWIAETWGWPWIFLINIPVSIVVLVVSWQLLPGHRHPQSRFDWQGFALAGSGFGLFMAGLESLSTGIEHLAVPVLVAGSGAFLLVVATRHMLTQKHALLSLTAMHYKTYRHTVLEASAIRIVISGAPFLIPLQLQLTMGYSPLEAGTLMLWLFAGNIAVKPLTTGLMRLCGFRILLSTNALLIAMGYIALGMCNSDTTGFILACVLFLNGVFRSVHLTALNTLCFADIPQPHMRDANTLNAVLMQMNRGLGITVAALTLSTCAVLLEDAIEAPSSLTFTLTYTMIAAVALLAAANSWRLSSQAGAAVLQKAPQ